MDKDQRAKEMLVEAMEKLGNTARWYKRDGTPISAEEFLSLKEDRRVALDKIWGGRVLSTVFLGLDSFIPNDKPLIFETMIFGGRHDHTLAQYSTESEAIAGHKRALRRAKWGLKPFK